MLTPYVIFSGGPPVRFNDSIIERALKDKVREVCIGGVGRQKGEERMERSEASSPPFGDATFCACCLAGAAAGMSRKGGEGREFATKVLHACFGAPDQSKRGEKRRRKNTTIGMQQFLAKISKKGGDGGAAGLGHQADVGWKVVAELQWLEAAFTLPEIGKGTDRGLVASRGIRKSAPILGCTHCSAQFDKIRNFAAQ